MLIILNQCSNSLGFAVDLHRPHGVPVRIVLCYKGAVLYIGDQRKEPHMSSRGCMAADSRAGCGKGQSIGPSGPLPSEQNLDAI